MLNAGVEVFTDLIPSVGGERVNYANVFRHLEETTGVRVTYGSVHERIWDSQRDFQVDVVRRAVTQLVDHTTAGAEKVAAEIIANIDLDSVDGRREAAKECARLIGDANAAAVLESPLSRLQRAISFRYALLREGNPERDELKEAVTEGFNLAEERFIAVYGTMISALGLRPRRAVFGDDTDACVKVLTRLGRSIVDGALIVSSVAGNEPMTLPTGPNGASQQWTLPALGAWSLVQSLLEIDGIDNPLESRL